MIRDCSTCKHDWNADGYCDDCYNGYPPTKWESNVSGDASTNADRIRAMSDKELASSIYIPCPYYNSVQGGCKFGSNEHTQTCKECILEWLQQPVKQ